MRRDCINSFEIFRNEIESNSERHRLIRLPGRALASTNRIANFNVLLRSADPLGLRVRRRVDRYHRFIPMNEARNQAYLFEIVWR